MKTLKISFLIVLSLTLSFCGNDKKSSDASSDIISAEKEASYNQPDDVPGLEVVEVDTNAEDTVYPEPQVHARFKNEKIEDAYKQYSKIQNALVNTNASNASTHAASLVEALKKVGTEDGVVQAAQNMVVSQDIELQRAQFVVITAEMEKMLKGAFDSGMVYKMYCPMAFKNTGAYWLSSDKKIQNPYFGDKMLRCGRVDSAIE